MDLKKVFELIGASEIEGKEDVAKALNEYHAKLNGEAKDNRLKSEGFEGQFAEMQATMKTLMGAVNGKTPEGNLSDIDAKSFAHQIKTLQESVQVLTTDKENAIGERNKAQLNSEFKTIFGDKVIEDFQSDLIRDLGGRFSKNKDGAFVDSEGVPMAENLNKMLEGNQHLLRNTVQTGADTPQAQSTSPKTFADAKTGVEKFDAMMNQMKQQ